MYWLLQENKQQEIRKMIEDLTLSLANVSGNPQEDQIFPYVGRKDRRKGIKAVEYLCPQNGVVIEPLSGSGSLVYATAESNRTVYANEWEPYAWRMSNAPWRLPAEKELNEAVDVVKQIMDPVSHWLYKTICVCGNEHVLDSLFFDRRPLRYRNISQHERLGPNGENITYRGKYACPVCHRTEKHFDDSDQAHLDSLSRTSVNLIFNTHLIENSRINLNSEFTTYGNLFPHRSKLALIKLWECINATNCSQSTTLFLQDAFLSILPQAKYKDYRSKSQDLHCPPIKLREVNIFYRYFDQIERRYERLRHYSFHKEHGTSLSSSPIACMDFRDFMAGISVRSGDLILTDPPWLDGNAYFEKAQLYHPWLGYSLINDQDRLTREFVITDAPSRSSEHDTERWWQDMTELFKHSKRILKNDRFLVLYFRPIPASDWLTNLNRLKLIARQNGFEPLLSIDVGSSDPSMRIQQSASYVFSRDIMFVFLSLDRAISRTYAGNIDLDQLVFETAESLQESLYRPFFYKEWRDKMADELNRLNLGEFNVPNTEPILLGLFRRYCDEVTQGQYLPKLNTPFSGQLFDIPAIERLFTYIPQIVNSLTSTKDQFSYDEFLLSLSTFVENGTRSLIGQIQELDIELMISPYAEPILGGRFFKKRRLPTISLPIRNIMDFDPYEFENFVGQLLSAQGFTNIAVIGRAGDRGVDLIADDPDRKKTVIQCKRYIGHNVSSTPIQRLHSFAVTRNADRKILVTTSDFTPQAYQEAGHTQTELVNGVQLERLVAKYLPNLNK